jgi:uncharacterized protein (TIGR02117 family)
MRARLNRWLRRALLAIGGVLTLYACFLLLGFVPVNRDHQPPPEGERVRVFVRSNEIHTDLVLPACDDASACDWRELFPPEHFRGDVRNHKYVAIGWGNRAFYIETPRWTDLRLSTAVRALFPDQGVLHAEYLYDVAAGEHFHELQLSRDEYRQLTEFVRSSIGELDGEGYAKQASTKSYSSCDRFYTSTGSYHAFNTCNQWTGRGLKAAGQPTGIWTPLRPQVLCWLD